MDERFLIHTETNGVREVGYVLLGRSEAMEHLEIDRARHESDGWDVHPSGDDPLRIVMTRGSTTRRVWLERYATEPTATEDERDIRQLLARGFEYARSIGA